MTRMARIRNSLRKLTTGWMGSQTRGLKTLPIRVMRAIRGFNFGVRPHLVPIRVPSVFHPWLMNRSVIWQRSPYVRRPRMYGIAGEGDKYRVAKTG